ncbi:zinc-binding dehydrogenase [Streptomyces sp. NBC_01390]|uniref:zinc-binding dehydrogenase n=1 Tax=Streptomyces sp. NBC_01390 TaxID=2903850 RepID=UPI00324D5F37
MLVVRVERFGSPEVLTPRELPDPVAGPGQVVIEVAVADVLFIETQVRGGWGREFFSVQPPYVPGDGVAGHVLSAGEGVDRGLVGQRVAVHVGGYGGYAERVVVPAESLIRVPNGLGLPEAASLLNDGPTALTVFETAKVAPRSRVLVLPAAGGFGSLLVQLAHAAGAQVIGAARGEHKLAAVRERGAGVVVDYSLPDWPERVLEATGGVGADVVFDGVGGDIGRYAFALTAPGGQFSAHGAPSGGFAQVDRQEAERRAVSVRGIQDVQLPDSERRRLAEQAITEAAAGRLRPLIGQTFPLRQAAEAHAAIEGRTVVGKTLLLA